MRYEPYLPPEQLLPLDRWCRRFVLVVGIPLVIFLLLTGCATAEPYWVKTHELVPVTGIHYVDKPCGLDGADGCANRRTGIIEIKRGLVASLAWCVEQHERKHMAGYSHPGSAHRMQFATDCGNGEKL